MLCYTLENFNEIISNRVDYKLDPSVCDIIKTIADQVGDPEYSKTPQFSKKKREYNIKQYANDTRNFKITKKITKEGVALSIDTIRKHLNKLSKKTYDKLSQEIIQEIQDMIDCNIVDENEKPDVIKNMNLVGTEIFNIASSSVFYSEMYAKLYHTLMSKFEIMKTIFMENFITFRTVFHKIDYCDPNVNYDTFCENNKANQKRRALALFYVNLMKLGAVSNDSIIDIIHDMQNYMKKQISAENMASVVEELCEVIAIMVCSSKQNLDEHDSWGDIVGYITEVSQMKAKQSPSITHKTIFKHMDILDDLK